MLCIMILEEKNKLPGTSEQTFLARLSTEKRKVTFQRFNCYSTLHCLCGLTQHIQNSRNDSIHSHLPPVETYSKKFSVYCCCCRNAHTFLGRRKRDSNAVLPVLLAYGTRDAHIFQCYFKYQYNEACFICPLELSETFRIVCLQRTQDVIKSPLFLHY